MSKEEIVIKNKYPGIIKQGYIITYAIDSGKIIVNEDLKNLDKCLDYVITKKYELVLGISHSFLAKGEDVLAVGMFRLDSEGTVIEVSNESGHYKPTSEETLRAIELIERFGINLSGATINNKKYI